MKRITTLLTLFLFLRFGAFAQLADRNYADLLRKSILFFEAQASGPDVEEYSSFDWRGNCHTSDGQDLGLDLTGGWHDAGDHVKFNYPMGQAVYNLATLYVDHREQVDATGNKDLLLKQLRFISDYMIRCHPEPNSYVIQVAEGELDHSFWQVPEQNTYERRSYMADLDNPNTELACANAAAFAALSMAFRGVDDDYSAELLQHARELYDFGYNNQVSYNANTELPDREFDFYDSDNGFQDEIMVGAAWLYRATGEQRYRDEAAAAFASDELNNYVGGWAPAWGDHQYEAAYQMARATGESLYLDALERYVVAIANGSEGQESPGGMWQASAKGATAGFALPMSLGAASLAYRYAELVGSSNANYTLVRNFAFGQVNYALGDNPLERSYVVDFGDNFPQITHHRAAHSPEGGSGLINSNPTEDAHTITGALVMGPILDDSYDNTRSEIKYTEPALGNNGILTLTAALMVQETNATAEPPSDPDPEPPVADQGTIIINAQGDCGVERMELRIDGEPVDAWTVSTNPNNYLYQGFTGGEVSVHFLNDSFGNGNACDDNNLMVDFIEVCGVKYQTETVATKSVDCCQVPDKLYTNGNFNFGSLSCQETTDGQIVVRAKGDCGSETMILEVDGQEVETWTEVATSYDDYPYAGYQGGTIKVKFVNNQSSPCDRNLYVDYIEVCGTRIQSESSSVVQNTNWTNGDQQILFSNGDNNYGNPGCGSARTASGNAKERFDPAAGAWDDSFKVYPNPASDQLTVRGGRDYQVTVYDLSGRPVMQHQHLRGQKTLNVAHLKPGLYLMRVQDDQQRHTSRQIVIK